MSRPDRDLQEVGQTDVRAALTTRQRSGVIRALGHLAVWAAVYVVGAVVCCAQLMGMPILRPEGVGAAALVFAWATAVFAYLLDRVKARDAWLDPADRVAHPTRYEFLLARVRWVRGAAVAMGLISAWSGWLMHPLLPMATLATAAGVMAYAGVPGSVREGGRTWARIKDRFVLKNLFVAAGIAGFALVVVAAAIERGRGGRATVEWCAARPLLIILAVSHLIVRVFADAVLCDIDDEVSDREHATHTLPTRMGGEQAWKIAMWLRLGLAASLLVWPAGPWRARAAWAAVTAASTIGLRAWRPGRVRDVVDARFALEAMAVWLLLSIWGD